MIDNKESREHRSDEMIQENIKYDTENRHEDLVA